jgi:hypothetical protein
VPLSQPGIRAVEPGDRFRLFLESPIEVLADTARRSTSRILSSSIAARFFAAGIP